MLNQVDITDIFCKASCFLTTFTKLCLVLWLCCICVIICDVIWCHLVLRGIPREVHYPEQEQVLLRKSMSCFSSYRFSSQWFQRVIVWMSMSCFSSYRFSSQWFQRVIVWMSMSCFSSYRFSSQWFQCVTMWLLIVFRWVEWISCYEDLLISLTTCNFMWV